MPLSLRLPRLGAAVLILGAIGCSPSSPPATPDAGTPSGSVYPPIVDRTSCSGLTVGPGNYTWTLRHQDRDRSYNVHVPTGYDPTKPTPTVVAFHGFASNAQQQEGLSRMSQVADEKGFIAVYPQGLNYPESVRSPDAGYDNSQGWNAGGCCGPAQVYGVDDVGFVEAIFADLDTRVCVDTRRTYATGLSNGAFFTYRLACERAARFAAIAPVSGMENVVPCEPSRPVPVMHFHGTADDNISYDGGTIPLRAPLPVRTGHSSEVGRAQWLRRPPPGDVPPGRQHLRHAHRLRRPGHPLHDPGRRPHLARRPHTSAVRLHDEGSGRHARDVALLRGPPPPLRAP